jgi:dihydroflavonol-4-reductase
MSGTFLITGASGFLGRHTIDAIRRSGSATRPVALVRDVAAWEKLDWHGGVPAIQGELFEPRRWENHPLLGDLKGVFHLAGVVQHTRRAPEAMHRTNVEGTRNMVALAGRKGARVILASTSGTVGVSKRIHDAVDEDAPYIEHKLRGWPYYLSKVEAEKAARKTADEMGVELIFARPPVLLGPGDHRFRSTSNILRLLRRKLPFILDGGMNFVDIRDVADALVRAMQVEKPRPVYHFPGTQCTLDQFFRWCADEAGLPPNWIKLPGKALWGIAMLNQMTANLHVVPDPVVIEMGAHHWGVKSKYIAELGFRNRPARETLADTIAWLRENHPELKGQGMTSARTLVSV